MVLTRKRKKYLFKSFVSMTLASATVLSGVPLEGLSGIVETAKAAGQPAVREDNSIVYFVDCGDYNVKTVSEGDQLGTHNSVTDQIYGEDQATGYKWGVDDTVSTPLNNGSSNTGGADTDWTWPYEFNSADGVPKTSSNRYTKNQFEKGVEKMATAIPLALDGGLRQPKVVVCDMLTSWEHGNQKTDTGIYYSIILFPCVNTERNC